MTDGQSATSALDLMQGYPVPVERRVTRANLLIPPNNRWSFQHIRELLPTAEVYRGGGPARSFNRRERDLDGLRFDAADGTSSTIDQMLHATFVDALIVLHQGDLVYERYLNGMTPASQHQMMSVTKSIVGTLALQLVHEGMIDESQPVSYYLPELKGSAWEDATIRHALDMSTGIAFDEVYEAGESDFFRYLIAYGFAEIPPDYTGPRTIPELFPTFRKSGEHGEVFHYVTPNTDVIGWIIGRVTGMPLSRAISDRIWSRLGTERDGYIVRDTVGMDMAGGGFNATARDMARFGQMILDKGRSGNDQIVAPEVTAAIRAGGDRNAFALGMPDAGPIWKGWSYRAFWWHTHNEHQAFTGIGINGQWLYIDPTARVVVVLQSSHPVPDSPESDDILVPAFHAIARRLHTEKST